MTENSSTMDPSLLENYVEQMTGLSASVIDQQRDLAQLRQDAKTDGFNVDALNFLIQIRAKNFSDGGAEVLNDLISYASRSGIQLDLVAAPEAAAWTTPTQTVGDMWDEVDYSPDPTSVSQRLKPVAQLALGALITAAMLWYLR